VAQPLAESGYIANHINPRPEQEVIMKIPKTEKGKQDKVEKVMKEFKEGALKSSSGDKVESRKQAIAIALSEAGKSKNKKKS
jgi:hypothetical protein